MFRDKILVGEVDDLRNSIKNIREELDVDRSNENVIINNTLLGFGWDSRKIGDVVLNLEEKVDLILEYLKLEYEPQQEKKSTLVKKKKK